MRLQILVISSLLAIATAATIPIPKCGGNWQQLNEQCFLVVNSQKQWSAARKDCQKNKGGDLAIINDDATTTFIKTLLQGASGQYWIGLHDVITENTFKWVDDTALGSYNQWNPGEPNNVGNEDCVALYASSAKWNDDGCSTAKPYICSRLSTVLAKCDESNNWRSYDGKCYRFATSAANWQDAETNCAFHTGGHIAYVKKQADQDFLANLQITNSYSYWIGLTDKENGQPGEYQWSDKTTFDPNVYNQWKTNEPSNKWHGQEGDCAFVNKQGQWVVNKCNVKYRYICEIPEGTCPVGWASHGGFCYQINAASNNLMTWTDAKDYCSAQGAVLSPILGSSENIFLASYLSGLDSNGITDLFFGLSDISADGTYTWVTGGSPSGISKNWAPGEPATKNGQKDCASLKSADTNGQWYAGDCFKLAASVCRIPVGTPLTYVPPGPVTEHCDNADYDFYGSRCYKIYLTKKNWADAKTSCENENAQLVVIKDDGIQSFMSTRLNAVKQRVWMGLKDVDNKDVFKWTDGTALGSYNNWAPGFPGSANCVSLTGAATNYGLWKTRACSETNYYACEKNSQTGVGPSSKPNPTAGFNDRCGNGWEYDKDSDKCFLFRPYALENWFDARRLCRQEGGDLLSIQGSDDMSYSNGRIKSFGAGFTWIGCNDLGVEGGWGWSDGKPFAKINWAPGQPNNYDTYYSGGQHCCEVWNTYGDWNDDDCYYAHPYACSRDEYIFKYFTTYTEKKMDETIDLQLDDMWPRQCAERCVLETTFTCLSFDYDRQSRTCLLRKVDKSSGGLLPTYGDSQHFDYYERDLNVQPQPPPQPSPLNCPSGWKRYLDDCYYANYNKLEFDPAEAACPNGAKLASVTDANVNHFLQAFVWELNAQNSVSDTRFWIGLNDKAVENEFKWTNGEKVTFTSWNAYEPNNVNGEDCIEMYADNGLWNDLPCTGYSYGSLCKQAVASGNPNPPANQCPSGWVQWIDRCYLLSTSKATWSGASTECKKTTGAQLVIIEDKLEMAFLSGQLGQEQGGLYVGDEFFIALSDNNQDKPGLYEWMDKTPITYTHWAEGQPDDRTGHCVTASSGRNAGFWADRDCTTQYRYICEKARNGLPNIKPPTFAPPTTPSSLQCQPDWVGYGSLCYKAFELDSNELVDWDEANRICSNFGGALASLHHPDQEQYLVDNLKVTSNTKFWIGLNDQRMEGGYTWSDGTEVEYTNWGGGEPNDYGGQEECVETGLKGGKWNDLFCWYKRNFLCSIPKGQPVVTTLAPTPPPGGDCYNDGSNWVHLSPYCYKFNSYWVDWYEANKDCHDNDAHLVSIHSDAEQDFVKQRLQFGYDYWIGLKANLTHPGDHVWEDGSPYDYINWLGSPDSGNGDKLCSMTIGSESSDKGKWETHNCGDLAYYVCKKRFDSIPATHAPTSSPDGGCKPGWKKYSDNYCYKFMGLDSQNDPKLKWADAKQACIDADAFLASVHDLQVHNTLTADLITVDNDVWIGMSNIGTDGNYLWADSTSRDLYGWAYNQPVYDFSQNATSSCVCMKYEDEETGRWFSENCELLHSYLCKTPTIAGSTATPAPPTPCQVDDDKLKDYVQYGSACFKVDISVKKTYEEATALCEGDGATLASIMNGFEQAQLVTMTNDADDRTWIGLTVDADTQMFTWADGWPFQTEYWSWTSPNGNNCTAMSAERAYIWYNGLWETVACDNKYYTACKYNTESPPTPPPTQAGYCEAGWTAFGSSCYIMGTGNFETATFKEAVYDCDRYYGGAHVATISSKAENQFVMNLAQQTFTLSWILIGLERGNDGNWEWMDGTPLVYSNWADNAWDYESNNCAEIRTSAQGKWDTIGCEVQSHYVCEKPKTRITSTEAPFLPPDCSTQYQTTGWKQLGEYCYLFVNSYSSYFEAEADCNSKGGYLASITSEEEQYFVKKLSSQGFWGLHLWLGLRKDTVSGDYKWTDSVATNYKNWDPTGNEPNDRDGMSTCTQMWHDGEWVSHNCGVQTDYTCKRKFDSQSPVTKPTLPPPQGNCPENWFQVENGCYQIRQEQMMWNDSRADCMKEDGGDLAPIRTQLTQSFLTSKMKGVTDSLWIGFRTLDSRETWGYHWVDESDSTYTHWSRTSPNNYWGEYCAALATDDQFPGRWIDISCSEKHGYVCYKPLDESLPTAPPPANSCAKEGYLQYDEDCFKINTEKMSFDQASQACANDGGSMATISDGYAEAFAMYISLLQIVEGAPLDSVWIGLSADNGTRQFKWQDGWPLQYTNWNYNEPQEEVGLCTQLTQNTFWETAPCDNATRAPFICRITTAVKPTEPTYTGTCSGDFEPFENSCFLFTSASTGDETWYEAQYKCEKDHNSRLLNIHSKTQNDFIQKKFAENFPDSYNWDGIWLDLTRNASADGRTSFIWNDGHPFDYDNWDAEEPELNDNYDRVMMMPKGYGKWQTSPDYYTGYFVCHKYQDTTGPERSTGLGGGAIAGIVIGVFLLVILVIGIGYFFLKNRQVRKPLDDPGLPPTTGFDNVLYTPSLDEVKTKDIDTKTGTMSDA